MNAVDLHPEDLLERARRGSVSAEERQRLAAHLAECPACAFEQGLALDCAEAAAPAPGDEALLVRVRGGAARALRAERRLRRGLPARRRLPVGASAAAAILLAATLAAATTVVHRVWTGGLRRAETVAQRQPTARARGAVVAMRPRAPVVIPAANETPPVAEPVPREAPPAPVRSAQRKAEAALATPAALFARANLARRRGETREAARLYRELQRAYPGSPEELVSRVTFGRWLLDRMDDPRGALAAFDSYLANPTHAALREEALIGRALALGRLGRRSEERAAWAAFLAAYPASAYAEPARVRLEERR